MCRGECGRYDGDQGRKEPERAGVGGGWCPGHRPGTRRAEAKAPKGLERCHSYNNTLNLDRAFRFTRTLRLSKTFLVFISISGVYEASTDF